MTPDFRTLCADAAVALENPTYHASDRAALLDRLRTALAEFQPELYDLQMSLDEIINRIDSPSLSEAIIGELRKLISIAFHCHQSPTPPRQP